LRKARPLFLLYSNPVHCSGDVFEIPPPRSFKRMTPFYPLIPFPSSSIQTFFALLYLPSPDLQHSTSLVKFLFFLPLLPSLSLCPLIFTLLSFLFRQDTSPTRSRSQLFPARLTDFFFAHCPCPLSLACGSLRRIPLRHSLFCWPQEPVNFPSFSFSTTLSLCSALFFPKRLVVTAIVTLLIVDLQFPLCRERSADFLLASAVLSITPFPRACHPFPLPYPSPPGPTRPFLRFFIPPQMRHRNGLKTFVLTLFLYKAWQRNVPDFP